MTLVEKIKDILESNDPRTIEEMIEDDHPNTYIINEARKISDWENDHGYEITYNNGWTRIVESHKPINVNDKITLYEGINELYGLKLNDELIYYLTPMERAVKDLNWLAERDRRQRENFSKNKEKLDKDYESLPEPLKKRIDRFREQDLSFRIDSEPYELFCCVEAAKFLGAANTRYVKDQKEVDKFWDDEHTRMKAGGSDTVWGKIPTDPKIRWLLWVWALNTEAYGYDYEKQKKLINSSDDHSGNTFGGAMHLAISILEGREV